MPYFPPPPDLPARTGLFRRVPPAIFPAVLGLLGLVAAWTRAATVFAIPTALVQTASGMVALLFLFCVVAYAAKFVRRPGTLPDDLATLPGRTGVAALCLGLIVQATILLPLIPALAMVLLGVGGFGLLLLAIVVLAERVTGRDTTGPLTPAMHLVFVGFILIPGAALPMGLMPNAMPWLIGYCAIAALIISALTLRPLILGDGAPPLRPLHCIQLAPPAFIATGCFLIGQTTAAVIALIWATIVALLLLWRARWMTEGPFSGFWSAFTFPVTAFAAALLLAHDAHGWEICRLAGGVVLIAATLYIPVIAYRVLKLWAAGTLAVKTNASSA